MKNTLRYSGSLTFNREFIVSPYDCEKIKTQNKLTPLCLKSVKNYSKKSFEIDFKKIKKLCIINGMGVTLGDSIIGLCCIDIIKKINPALSIKIIRPWSCKKYVNDIYKASNFLYDDIEFMPYAIGKIDTKAINIDIGNQLYWKDFNTLEMHDFFLRNLGVNYKNKSLKKQNSFLKKTIPHLCGKGERFSVFCPYASTKLRSIPEVYHKKIINKLIKKMKIPVLGFSKVEMPGYKFIGDITKNTIDFISIIAKSSYVYTVDSSALHIAAGFEVPTYCLFTSIRPELRSIYYPYCQANYIGFKEVENLHESDNRDILNLVNKSYEQIFKDSNMEV